MKTMLCSAAIALLVCATYHFNTAPLENAAMAADATSEPLLAHNVFFKLKDNSPAAVRKLVAACKKYLTNHPGTVLFAAGDLSDLSREVNDRDFDVALHLIFKNRAAHDAYQVAPRHEEFIAENKENWAKVRVFDSNVSQ